MGFNLLFDSDDAVSFYAPLPKGVRPLPAVPPEAII